MWHDLYIWMSDESFWAYFLMSQINSDESLRNSSDTLLSKRTFVFPHKMHTRMYYLDLHTVLSQEKSAQFEKFDIQVFRLKSKLRRTMEKL